MIDPLLSALLAGPIMGDGQALELSSGPSSSVLKVEMNALVDRMVLCAETCAGVDTAKTVTAVCAAAFGSALMLVQ